MSFAQPYHASYSLPQQDGVILCTPCPQACRLKHGATGRCRVRRNLDGVLVSDSYGYPVAMHVDPVEKKPLHHFLPGSHTFSIGTRGCNLACRFCQNSQLSRQGYERDDQSHYVAPEEVVALAQRYNCRSIAFTYNEPTVYIEYAIAIARLAREAGLATLLVSNGYINPGPRDDLYALIDAANIDLKAYSEEFYASICDARLAPVLASLRSFKHDHAGHLELTNLLIPGYNDAPDEIGKLLDWVAAELGYDTPLHFSAYTPHGGFTAPATPPRTVYQAALIARQRGFQAVHTGNV